MSTRDSLQWLKHPMFLNYGVAVLSVTAALIIALWMEIQFGFEPLNPFLCAIMFSAVLGGVKPGLISAALSILAFYYYFLLPTHPGIEKDIPRLLMALVTALFIVWLSAAQRSAAEALRESNQRLLQITENIREVFWMATPSMDELLYVSPAYESIWGRSLESLRQRPQSFFEAIHPEDREHAVSVIKGQRDHGFDVEYRILRPDGSVRWIRDRGFPVNDASGKVYRIAGITEDITEQKESEKALRHSERKLHEREELYRMLMENTNEFVRIHELDGRSTYGSPSVVRLYGREPADFFEFAHPEDLESCRQWWARVLARTSERLVWRIRDRDGAWHWMETQGSLVEHEGRQHVMTVCRDVTERKQADEALRQSECDLAEAQRVARLGSWTFDFASDTVRWSEELYRIFDVEKTAFDGTYETFLSRVHPDDRAQVVRANAGSRSSGKPFEIEYRIKTPNDQLKYIREVGHARMDSAGAVSGLLGTAQDITERKRAEDEALQTAQKIQALSVEKETHLRLVVDTIPTMAWTLQPDGTVDFVNQRSLEYSGRSLSEALEEPNRMVHPEDLPTVMEKWRGAIAAGEPYEDEMRLRRVDGEYRWFLVRTVPLRDAQGNIVKWYGTSTDIEDRRRAEDALRDSGVQLQALSRRLVELQEAERKELARELHDRVGQSLTALNINLNILRTTLPAQASDELRARLADSETLSESTAAAIRNVLSELRPPMLDDHGLVLALDCYARQFSARTGVTVVVRGQESVERLAPEMEIALFRIAQEALNNVVKHAQASKVEITLERSGSEYVMSVQDDGVGFDATEGLAARHPGLGMVTIRERAQAIGGKFELRAVPGDGTRLIVQVPL